MKQVRIDVVANGYMVIIDTRGTASSDCYVFNLFEDMVNFLSVALMREQEKE